MRSKKKLFFTKKKPQFLPNCTKQPPSPSFTKNPPSKVGGFFLVRFGVFFLERSGGFLVTLGINLGLFLYTFRAWISFVASISYKEPLTQLLLRYLHRSVEVLNHNSRGPTGAWESITPTQGATLNRGSPSPQLEGPHWQVGVHHPRSRGHTTLWIQESLSPTQGATKNLWGSSPWPKSCT